MFRSIVAFTLLTYTASSATVPDSNPEPNQKLKSDIRHQLLTLPLLNVFDNLSFRSDGGVVTLYGQVTRPTLKSDAGRVVKRIEGIESVDNRIEVLPLSHHDDRLRRALYIAIYGYPPMQRYAMPVIKPIRIIVKNGHVTLEGVVNTTSDRDIANIRANGVHGVFSVTNNLRLEHDPAKGDLVSAMF